MRLKIAGIAAATLLVGLGFFQPVRACAQGQSQDAQAKLPEFEVASIKPSRPDDQSHNWNSRGGVVFIKNYTLRRLIRTAYGLKSDSQVMGRPTWLYYRAFDIEAKFDETEGAKLRDMTGQARSREFRLALQSLLANRFQLRVHPNSQDFPIYALVVARGGAKLANAAPSLDADGKPKAERDHNIHDGNGHMTATGISMGDLADWLTLYADSDRVVLDRTGLTGDYDLKLDWTEDNTEGIPADAQYPGLFTALQEQLELKLEPQQGPVEALVIDHIEQLSAN